MNYSDNHSFYNYLFNELSENGYVVIHNFYSKEKCDEIMSQILNSFIKLNTNINPQDIKNTWIPENLPPQTRPGLFQGIMCNLPCNWEARLDERLIKIFQVLYSKFRGKNIDDLIVSNDGINFRPNGLKPYANDNDWAHLDITLRNSMFECIQGQIVLANTSASFRCSPKSHKIYENILDKCGIDINDKSNWCKFDRKNHELLNDIKTSIENIGGQYQIPIIEPAGSVILWLSSLVHSGKLADREEESDMMDLWKGWRGIFYICYRPREDFKKSELKKREKVVRENRATNHWGNKMFPKCTTSPYMNKNFYCPIIQKYIDEPSLYYDDTGLKPPFTNEIFKKVVGI